MNSIYLDCEWYPRGRIFLIGYRINNKTSKALWGSKIDNFPNLLKRNKGAFLFVLFQFHTGSINTRLTMHL